jgi:hypothetical protein
VGLKQHEGSAAIVAAIGSNAELVMELEHISEQQQYVITSQQGFDRLGLQ